MLTEPPVAIQEYIDSFGNRCSRFVAEPGYIRLYASTLIEDSGLEDPILLQARQHEVAELPAGDPSIPSCQPLLRSGFDVEHRNGALRSHAARLVARVCHHCLGESESDIWLPVCPFHWTALDTYTERMGVCRDFQHLAITFCRAMNIPARYATGYLGDIGVPLSDTPMDFSAWFEVYLDGAWCTFDARHNRPRIGRVLMAVGRDAADVAITTSFGNARLTQFSVVTDEVKEETTLATPA